MCNSPEAEASAEHSHPKLTLTDTAAGPGIGRSINAISEIEQLQRPLTMEEGGIVLMDLLWSDPTTNDAVEGVQPSPRGPGLVTFGPDRVKEFCRVPLSDNT